MNEIEKIQRYIERTPLDKDKYYLDVEKGFALARAAHEMSDLPLEVICLAFNYGKANGYRQAKAEARNK